MFNLKDQAYPYDVALTLVKEITKVYKDYKE